LMFVEANSQHHTTSQENEIKELLQYDNIRRCTMQLSFHIN
jgi:hypothetical protein